MRIVFLDIDGPIINTPMFYLDMQCSMQRTQMNTQALAYVKRLCKIANAKLVCNSTHNTHVVEDQLTGERRTLKDDLIRWGIPADLFHDRWCTNYPGYRGRLSSINDWIDDGRERFGETDEVDWVCFDDVRFTDSKRLIVIDFDLGIDFAAYRKAAKVWGIRQEPNLVL